MVGDLNLEVLAVVDNAQTFVVDPDNKGVLARFVLLDVEGDHVFTLVSVLANMGLCGGNVNVGLIDADLELAPLDRRSELKKRNVAKKNLDLSLRILTIVFFRLTIVDAEFLLLSRAMTYFSPCFISLRLIVTLSKV